MYSIAVLTLLHGNGNADAKYGAKIMGNHSFGYQKRSVFHTCVMDSFQSSRHERNPGSTAFGICVVLHPFCILRGPFLPSFAADRPTRWGKWIILFFIFISGTFLQNVLKTLWESNFPLRKYYFSLIFKEFVKIVFSNHTAKEEMSEILTANKDFRYFCFFIKNTGKDMVFFPSPIGK